MSGARTVMAVLAIASGLGVATPSLLARQRSAQDVAQLSRLIDALDGCIQARFRDVTDRFGVARIASPATPHRFEPESVAELSSVRALERAGRHVILYVAGTRGLRPAPSLALLTAAHARAIVKGPVRMTPRVTTEPLTPPTAAEIWEDGRRAMRAFQAGDTHDFARPGWTFTARAVRASTAACVECHRHDVLSPGRHSTDPVQIGDVLGVVIYGVRADR